LRLVDRDHVTCVASDDLASAFRQRDPIPLQAMPCRVGSPGTRDHDRCAINVAATTMSVTVSPA
jgi:hypothetical protein